MTLQHKIFQSRINGLNEQLPAGGIGFGASNTPPQVPRIQGNFASREIPRLQPRMTTRALSGGPVGGEPPMVPTEA